MVDASIGNIRLVADESERSEMHTLFMAWLNEKEEDRFEKAARFCDYVHISFEPPDAEKLHNYIEMRLNGRLLGYYRKSKAREYAYYQTQSRKESRRMLLEWFDRNCDVFKEYKATDRHIILNFARVPKSIRKTEGFMRNLHGHDYIPMELRKEDTDEKVLFGYFQVPEDGDGPVKNDRLRMSTGGHELAFILRTKRNKDYSELYKDFFSPDLVEFMHKPISERARIVKSFANENRVERKGIAWFAKVCDREIKEFYEHRYETSDKHPEMRIAIWYLAFKDKPAESLDECRFEAKYSKMYSKKRKELEAHFDFKKPIKEQIEEYVSKSNRKFTVDFLTRFCARIAKNREAVMAKAIAAGHKFDVESDQPSATASPKPKIAKMKKPTPESSTERNAD
ncbi:unnamed protein product [Caenorhabditis sp. 36 PRJEB53466]|nr:unnamed protein product [Caenorhabditis sp. 36 PRJEB53466]